MRSFSFVVLAVAAWSVVASPLVERKSKFCAGTWNNGTKYYCEDVRLGPERLPTKMPLSSELVGYDRLGGSKTPEAFLAKWWANGGYIYPPQDGFQLDTSGAPIQGQQELPVGLLIDRFGSEYGAFLAPADSPYSQRALPPQNLDTPAGGPPTYPYNYHVYKVLKSFIVASGPIAPWFGQPGQGTQYFSSSSVMALIAAGNIEAVPTDTADKRDELERAVAEQGAMRKRGVVLERDV